MSHIFTESELRAIHSRLSVLVTDTGGHLNKAKRCLTDGNLEGARVEMARAIRKQIRFVKKYDTTGRLASQIQELNHTKQRLLKGTTWSSCRKFFAHGWEVFGKISKDFDVKVISYLGGAVGIGTWIGKLFFGMNGDLAKDVRAWARRTKWMYRSVKATIKTLVDPQGREKFCDMCKSAWEVARDRAEKVWDETKKITARAVEGAKKVAVTGYRLARTAASNIAEKIRTAGHAVAEAASRTCSTIGSVASSAARTIGSTVRSTWSAVKSWFS